MKKGPTALLCHRFIDDVIIKLRRRTIYRRCCCRCCICVCVSSECRSRGHFLGISYLPLRLHFFFHNCSNDFSNSVGVIRKKMSYLSKAIAQRVSISNPRRVEFLSTSQAVLSIVSFVAFTLAKARTRYALREWKTVKLDVCMDGTGRRK